MHSVLENDTDAIDEGKLLNESFNQGVSSFMPDMIFENIVQNYSNAERIYGKKLIRLLTGYDPSYLRKNVRIPEFCRELKSGIESNVKNLRKKDLLDKEGSVTTLGVKLASLVLYTEELDKLIPRGIIGKKENRKKSHYGEKHDLRDYLSHDRFRDIDIKKTIKRSIRRGHSSIIRQDLSVNERRSKGNIEIIYALDASGSMRGKKIETAKKAGIALAFKAIENKDKVGLIVFGTDIKEEIHPTLDFTILLARITKIRASNETNITSTIEKAMRMFSKTKSTKHLILLSDAVPTIGSDPEKETLNAVSQASSTGITTSLVGIDLDKDGEKFAKKLTRLSKGRLYTVKNLENLDLMILDDYSFFAN
jgi:Mg-chelatase subunit ChlD